MDLTPTQQGMMFLYLMNPESKEYLEQIVIRVRGNLSQEDIKNAWRHLVLAHDCLRTIFKWDKLKSPLQIVLKKIDPPIYEKTTEEDFEVALEKIKLEEVNKGVDLADEPYRVCLLKNCPNETTIILTYHHILWDGWSNGILIDDFKRICKDIINSKAISTQIKETSFSEYIKLIRNRDIEKEKKYWKKYLKGYEHEHMIYDIPAMNEKGKEKKVQLFLDGEEYKELKEICVNKRHTIAGWLHAGLGLTLNKYSGNKDIIFGSTLSGRNANLSGIEKIVGLFINTLPMRVNLGENIKISEIIKKVEKDIKERAKYEATPMATIKECSGIKGNEDLFDIILVYENYPFEKENNSEIEVEVLSVKEETHFGMSITIMEVLKDTLEVTINYKEDKYSDEFVKGFLQHYKRVILDMIRCYDLRSEEIELLDKKEKEKLLKKFNNTKLIYDNEKTIVELFERQVLETPENIALVFGKEKLTYRELNQRANQLARKLRDKGVRSEKIVGIMTERSMEMIVGLLGILKAGGAYLPIDPEYPIDRISYMLEDSRADILLTQEHLIDRATFVGKIMDIEDEACYKGDWSNVGYASKSTDLAYIIYTSGSTGKPKGVMVEHRNIVAYTAAFKKEFSITSKDTVLQQATYCFDAFVEEVYPILTTGGKLVLAPKYEILDRNRLEKIIDDNDINIISCSPLFINEINSLKRIGNIHTLISGGDVLKQEYITNLMGHTRIYNTYGPTETTVCASYYKCEEKAPTSIPIGKPISNYKAYILDKNNRLQPIGIPGELCISGDGLTRGYLNRPELTAERFVENPYEPGERMYKTGDLVRWLPNGNIEFLGRVDDQIKIRGYRIELGEVENVLRQQAGVKEAVVMGREDSNQEKYLCGYIVKSQSITMDSIKEGVKEKLPDYMIPSVMVELENIPLTNSGKIDRRALQDMKVSISKEKEYEAPRNETEERLIAIWEDVLNTESIGISDNFFDLGGHSLKATILSGRIQRELEIEVTVRDIFECPEIRRLSERIKERSAKEYEELKPLEKQEKYPLSSAQRRIYAIQMMDKESIVYNMPLTLELRGKVDKAKIQGAIEKLISKHEALRTSFHLDGEEIVQKVQDEVNISLEYAKAEEKEEIDKIIEGWIKPFNLEKAPMLRGGIIETRDSHILMLDMHHIISDGTTMAVLAEDFVKSYEGIELDVELVQYKEYAAWEKKQKEKGVWDKQKEYWKKEYEGEIPVLELPMDEVRGRMEDNEGDRIRFEIDREILKGLNGTVKEVGGTLYMGLMAGFSILLSKYSGQEDIVIGSPIAGRRHPQMERVAGMFVNTLAIRTKPEGEKRIEDYLREMKKKLLKVYENQEYPYEELIEEVKVRRDLSRNPLFDVMLVLQNAEMKEVNLSQMQINPYEVDNKNAQFDITLNVEEDRDKLLCEAEYKSKLYSRETIENMMKHYIRILEEIARDKDRAIKEIELLDKEEKEKLVKQFNNTEKKYDNKITIVELFENQVERSPENIAVVYGEERLTYGELNKRANLLAGKLKKSGLGPETIATVIMDADISYIVGIMGILKAGGAYLPILPDYPKERIGFMLRDSNALCVVKQSDYTLEEYQGLIIDIDKSIEENKEENINNSKVENGAYILYTSGSTGKPKGVIIEHRNIANQIIGLIEDYGYGRMKNHMLYSKPIFDVSVQHIFTALCSGAVLHLMTEELKSDYNSLYKYVKENEIGFIDMVPAQMEAMVEALDEGCRDIRLVLGGEAFPSQLHQRIMEKARPKEIYNVYGPTETTINALIYKCREDEKGRSIPIGKPVRNYGIYILNKYNQLQPMGIPGELCIVGEGVARGYLNRPELTEESFVESPFEPEKRMYRTGDLARWMTDGNIEFLRRIDQQVKIRGYRIELGEVEKVLRKQNGVREVVVLDREDSTGNRYLCGYIVKEEAVSIKEIKAGAKQELPEYMVPSAMIELESIPLTNSGKIDRRALLNIDVEISSDRKYHAPRNKTEEKLIKIWTDILGVEGIGIGDNFFDLGGHSLKATILSGRIQKELGIEVSVKDIFEFPSIMELSDSIKESTRKEYERLTPLNNEESYPVSSAQRRIYAIQMMDKESIVYNMPLTLELKGKVDKAKIQGAIGKLIEKHEALRTSFHLNGEKIVQKIEEKLEIILEHVRVEEKADIDKILASWIKPFNLEKAPLLRGGIIETKDSHILMLDMHHIISDGATMSVLAEDFVGAYEGKDLEIEPVQYKEYANWEKEQREKGIWDKQKEYWKKEYEGEIPVLELPMDGVRGSIEDNSGDTIGFEIEEGTIRKLRERMSDIGGTLYMGLMAGYSILMSKYSSQEDIVVGTAVAGRRHPQMERVAGMFVNTLAIRSYPEGEKAVEEYLKETKQKLIGAYENQEYPYEELIEEVGVKRNLSRNPLFDVMLVLQNTELKEIKLPETEIKPYEVEDSTAKFDITLTAEEEGDRLVCEINYKNKLFRKETIEDMIKHYIKVLEEIAVNRKRTIKDISLLEKEEQKRLLYKLNDTKANYQDEKTIQELFEEQVERSPNRIALIYEDKKLTYRELNERANSLARVLRDKGVTRDSIVGIMVERSLEMIIGIMGIMKAGGAYLPIDPKYPKDRIQYMIEDSQAQIILICKEPREDLSINAQVIDLEDTRIYRRSISNLENITKSSDLAYIIYTSGSTGRPKGVMIEHKALVNRINWMQKKYPLGSEDIILQKTTFTFDVSVWELLWWSIYGGALYLLGPNHEKEPDKILRAIENEKITIMHFVPSMLGAFLKYIENVDINDKEIKLRQVFTSGEALQINHVKEFYKYFNRVKLSNLYGPTEATIDVSYYDCENKEYLKSIPIGKPIDNTGLYILDKNRNLQPIGISGELHISGDGLARGYLNRAKLTEEKFIESPFEKGARMYKTGDLARWLPDGNIEFLGRIDHQVKIRGYRIELGEIENTIRKQAGVKEIVVLAREDKDGDKYLCGYIVKEEAIEIEKVRNEAKKELPEYMVPGVIIEIEDIPLTGNGKIDRKALLSIEVTKSRTKEYEEPRNETEERLVEIWTDILGVERIGIKDNFFELGGHSLKATILSGRIQRELEAEIGVIDIFQIPTIEELGERIRKIQGQRYEALKPLEKRDSYPVSSAQKRLYAIQMMDKKSTLYNMPMILELRGKVDRFNIETAIKQLVKKHEALRTSFHMEGDRIVQKIQDNIDINIEYTEAESEEIVDEIIEGWIRPFDLEKSPLVRGGIIKEGDRHLLMLDMHHIISDGTTMVILEEDFVKAYEGEELKPQVVQYKEYAQWEKLQKENGNWDTKKDYWKKEYEGEIPVLELPLDRPRGKTEDNEGESIGFEIGEETLKCLRETMMKVGGTLYMGLMAGYSILLSKYSGQDDLVIGSPIAGRRHAQMENVAGVFINTLAIRSKPQGKKKVEEYLREMKNKLLYAYENQEYPYEELVEEVDIRRDLSRNPLFDVMLILQNTKRGEAYLSELEVKHYEVDNKTAKFDITLNIEEDERKLICLAEYKSRLYNKETIKRMMKHYVRILKEIGENKDKTIEEIEILDLAERKLLLEQYNDTKVEYDKEKTIIELFEEQVELAPESIALVYGKDKLTYKELNEKVNQIAWRLRDMEVKPEDIVGIITERSLEMMIGILGILKSGGAYLPIDPEYPEDRISYMLEDSGAEILLTTKGLREKISTNCDILTIEDELKNSEKNVNPNRINKASDLAYMIYTSGSTGRPKGVMLEHMSIHNFIKGMTENIAFEPNKVILALTTICFDIFLLETLLPLTKGMEVVIASEKVQRDPKLLAEAITMNDVNMLQMTPSRLQMLMNSDSDLAFLKDIEEIMIGGEAFPPALLKELQGLTSGKIYNIYGPTETTVWSTMKDVTSSKSINIGRPIANTKIYIVDKEKRLQPMGVPGELCIGGDGLARGYFKRPKLTAEKFVEIPFNQGEKMYRTGDLARWLPDGNIEFLGRTDHQVKLRGYRIELEEIENAINVQDGIKESIVIVKGDNSKNQYLCAYLVGEEIDVQSIKSSLKKKLPSYMVPTAYMILDKIPLTPNGKIDRKTLGSIKEPERNRKRIPPRNLHDSIIAEIWSEVLKLDEIYIYDDFFEIGGNSITIIQVASRIKEELGVEISMADLMVYTTILELSEYIMGLDNNTGKGFKHVFKINKSSSEKNIFIVHGADADILYYRHLAKLLEDEYSVYGIQPRGLNGEEPLPTSYFQMLHDYIKEIRMVQNDGPYILAGYCIGGYLSYDIVKILEIQGDKVLALLELDQEAFIEDAHRKTTRRYTNIIKVIEKWRRFRKKDKMYTTKKFMDIIPKAKPMSKERQMEILESREAIHDFFAKELPFNSMYCFLGYISTPTLVIKAEENDHHLFKKELWEKMHEGSFEYYEVPGGHETVLFPPYVDRVSELIKDYLNRMAGEELYEEKSC
ncbi:amino acid adenylation domain-containing protein [Wukongibacter sp. M2B1]|uniref:amino acid adenylation domain-containing protein n=1 Tax=Wukongibacter sp. M2B1 TaxID=3088895 RepID=UPI003D794C5D